MREENDAGRYLVRILRAVLHNEPPPELPENMDLEELYELAAEHRVAAMAFEGIQNTGTDDAAVIKKWEDRYYKDIALDSNQIYADRRIQRLFCKNGICVIPLKGLLLKKIYPQSYYRQMSDMDYLIKKEDARKVRCLLESKGFKTFSFLREKDDHYSKEPYLHLEVHRKMIGSSFPVLSRYYKNPWQRAVPDKESCLYKFSREDYYIYMIVHMAKHYYTAGSGIKSVLDVYIFNERYRKSLDRRYIEEELKKIGLLRFEKRAAAIARLWFGSGEEEEVPSLRSMERYILDGSTPEMAEEELLGIRDLFGGMIGNVKERNRRFYRWRLFPDLNYMAVKYEILNEYPFLLPFIWIKRGVDVLFNREIRTRVRHELRVLKKSDKED